MDIYQTESQQVEAIKDFFNRNGRLMVLIFVLFLIIVGSMRYWQHHTHVRNSQASNLFQMVLIAELNKDTAGITAKAEDLIANYSSTPYAQFAAFMLAKDAVVRQDYKTAEEKLRWIMAQRGAKGVSLHIATERLARVMMQRGEYDAALKLLDAKQPDKVYISLYEEAKGDIYLAKGNVAEAKIAYLKAMQDLPAGAQAPVLQLKLLDLGVGVENA